MNFPAMGNHVWQRANIGCASWLSVKQALECWVWLLVLGYPKVSPSSNILGWLSWKLKALHNSDIPERIMLTNTNIYYKH